MIFKEKESPIPTLGVGFFVSRIGEKTRQTGDPILTDKRHRLTLHGASAYAPQSIGSRSTLHRLTLHVASAYAPRSIGLRSNKRGITWYKVSSIIIGVRGKAPKARKNTAGGASPRDN
ncbi:MAG: hypothetical protein IKO60_00415, partial [Bacteroidaceae bacterium]|nr:hypothetical protein [Bacteroidaceae bacterium]